jgi:hypothetical protein
MREGIVEDKSNMKVRNKHSTHDVGRGKEGGRDDVTKVLAKKEVNWSQKKLVCTT